MIINWNIIKEDLKRVPILLLGLVTLSIGIYLTLIASLGLSSWGVFHDGLSKTFSITFGDITKIVGFIILTLSMIFLKTKIGVGTLLNILIIGTLIDFFESIYLVIPSSEMFYRRTALVFGVLFTTLGRSLYIASRLGPGPRDGVFVGLSSVLKLQTRYIKIIIEFIVLGIGILLGGTWGYGTVIIIMISGYLVQFFFKLYGYNPKNMRQSNISDYFEKPIFVKVLDISLLAIVFIILAFKYIH